MNQRIVSLGDVVTLDGSQSSDVDGDSLRFEWQILERPVDSLTELSDANKVSPTFVIDKDGEYRVKLVVSDGNQKSKADFINISTRNLKPNAILKISPPTQEDDYITGDVVQLDASESSDPENQTLFYNWVFATKPKLSQAFLDNDRSVQPSFVVDLAGPYILQLVVRDGVETSLTATVTINVITNNDPPIADIQDVTNSGNDIYVPGDVLLLDGSNSFDPEKQQLTYRWEIVEQPQGSMAQLTTTDGITTSFTADQVGHYTVHLYVDDGQFQSAFASIIYEVLEPIRLTDTRPFAEAGFDQPLYIENTVVTLDGSNSFDVENDPLSFLWEMLVKPSGSVAKLSDVAIAKPIFTADILGSYVIKLIVSDVNGDSHFDTVVITPHENPKLACGDCHNNVITPGKRADHLLNYDDCKSCHSTDSFLPTKGEFHAHGHKARPSRCIVCHDGVFAKTKPEGHIETDKECNACHLISNGTWVPALRVPGKPGFSHTGIIMGCVNCHDAVIEIGKPDGHMPASTRCGACHATNSWLPAVHLEHTQALGSCKNCHNPNQEQKVQPPNHLRTTNNCSACHTDEINWIPVLRVDHAEVLGSCVSCHNGNIAKGRSTAHIVSSTFCDKCHNTLNWTQVAITHDFFTGACIKCHNGVVSTGAPDTHTLKFSQLCEACHNEITWLPDRVSHKEVLGTCHGCHDQPGGEFQSATHIPATNKCENCHGIQAWRPVITVDHGESIGECIDCHNNIFARWKPSNHIDTVNVCEACHSTAIFKPALEVDHNMVLGNCMDCHNDWQVAGQNVSHVATTTVCEACHTTTDFSPTIFFDHLESTGPCNVCHDGSVAVGQSMVHMPTSQSCEKCHSSTVVSFLPVLKNGVDHTQVVGSCVSCHDNVIAFGKPDAHSSLVMNDSDRCAECHTTLRWSVGFVADHVSETADCARSGCHDGVTSVGQANNHIDATKVCEACHFTALFAPVMVTNHDEVLGSCVRCHNGSLAAGKSDSHVPTTNNCLTCHRKDIWDTNIFDHNELTGTCFSCHNGFDQSGKSANHMASNNDCRNCHTLRTWLGLTPQGHFLLAPKTCLGASCHLIGAVHAATVVEDCRSCHITADWLNWARPTTQRER